MFLGNREVYETTVQEPNFIIDQPDAESLLALMVEGLRTINRKRQRKELKAKGSL